MELWRWAQQCPLVHLVSRKVNSLTLHDAVLRRAYKEEVAFADALLRRRLRRGLSFAELQGEVQAGRFKASHRCTFTVLQYY